MNSSLIDRKTIDSGSYVFKEGEDASCAYVVQSGSVDIVKSDGEKETVLATIPEGGIFGEMGLIDDAPRMASARMREGGTVIVISRKTFEAKTATSDPFLRTLLKVFVNTIRRLQSGG